MDAHTLGLSVCGSCGRRTDGADLCALCVRASEPAKRTCCPSCGQWWRSDELITVDGGRECPGCGEVSGWVTVTEADTR